MAASSLERTLVELAGGTGVDYVTNADRIEGSVNVDTPKERAALEADAALVAKLDELSPEPKSERKPRGRWTHDSPQRFIPDEEGVA